MSTFRNIHIVTISPLTSIGKKEKQEKNDGFLFIMMIMYFGVLLRELWKPYRLQGKADNDLFYFT